MATATRSLGKAAASILRAALERANRAIRSALKQIEPAPARKQITGPKSPYRGGAYRDLEIPPGRDWQRHHMPADSASPASKGRGPCILMETSDHLETRSWGGSREARNHRARQRKLISEGRFDEAQALDIDDVRDKFPGKYDTAIDEMLNYTRSSDFRTYIEDVGD